MLKITLLSIFFFGSITWLWADGPLVSLGFSTPILSATVFPVLTPTPVNTPVPTATPLPEINVMGTVTYQGLGINNIYVFMTDNYGGNYLSTPLMNKGVFFFHESPRNVQGFVLWVCYDTTGNGIRLTPGGFPVEQGNGASLAGSRDVVCNVGYYGDCQLMGYNGGTHYAQDSQVNIVFGGGAGQSGSSCVP